MRQDKPTTAYLKKLDRENRHRTREIRELRQLLKLKDIPQELRQASEKRLHRLMKI